MINKCSLYYLCLWLNINIYKTECFTKLYIDAIDLKTKKGELHGYQL